MKNLPQKVFCIVATLSLALSPLAPSGNLFTGLAPIAEAASFVNIAVPTNTNLTSGLQLYYSFDNTKFSTTTVTDESGNGKTGTPSVARAAVGGSSANVEYLVVGGGGGGGGSTSFGGGGGGGGFRTGTGFAVTAQAYTITVGGGGNGTDSGNGGNGDNSIFSTITATGGGGGAGNTDVNGGSGGSGGGGAESAGQGGSASPAGQGNAGGAGGTNAGGGGGGAGAAGASSPSAKNGGNGGNGLSSSISGSATYYAGGGGGSGRSDQGGSAGNGGLGGGGKGRDYNVTAPVSGTANTGGGGGGAQSGGGGSATGGSGIVIISATIGDITNPTTAASCGAGCHTTAAGKDIWTFNSSGTWTPTIGGGSAATKAPLKVAGKIGSAIKFDSINASTTVGNVSSSVKTVAFWTKVSTSTVSQSVMDLNGAGANIRIVSGTVTANGFTSPTIYVDGAVSSTLNNTKWHHVVITTGTNVNVSNLSLGVASSTYYGGTLDDLRMYNRALTVAEVKRLHQLGATSYINTAVPSNTKNSSGLVLQYSFDSTKFSTTTVTDESGNGKTGTPSVARNAVAASGGSATATVKMWGAGGSGASGGGAGGGGGYTTGTFNVSEISYTIWVGEGGFAPGGSGTGVFGGGGDRSRYTAGWGGGLSGIFSGSATQGNAMMIAGGGGGGGTTWGADSTHGGGGGSSGQNGQLVGGGTQSSGGATESDPNAPATAGSALHGGTGGDRGGSGGSGYYGGGGDGEVNGGNEGGVGGGGSGYYNPASVSGGSTTAAAGQTPANSADADRGGAGDGGNANSAGDNGIVKISATTGAIANPTTAASCGAGCYTTSGGNDIWTFTSAASATFAPTLTPGTPASATTTAPLKVAGKIGSAIKFDGITASTTVGNVSSSVKTVAFWTKVSTSTASQSVMDLNGNGTNIRIVSGTVTANGFTSPTIYVDGAVSSTLNNKNWHHVVITTATNVNASNVNLGVASSTYFGGTLDDLRMYNRALSAAEAKRLYQLGATSYINTAVPSNTNNSSGLVLRYSFDNTKFSTTTVTDESGNGKTGTPSVARAGSTGGGGTNVELLVVAGGGGGGEAGYGGGGGGAGGLIYQSSVAVTAQGYTITVGGGGAGAQASYTDGSPGQNSSALGYTATGGGYGAGTNALSGRAGGNGGSGGGAAQRGNASGGAGVGGQGNNGGAVNDSHADAGAGGGGAGGVGANHNASGGGNGGVGLQYSQFASVGGSPAGWFAGGGGGGSSAATGSGGSGGGGNGGNPGAAGTANTGGGGGGGYYDAGYGGNGGSGIVIISATTGVITSATGGTFTQSGGKDIWTFNSGGTWTPTLPAGSATTTAPLKVPGKIGSAIKFDGITASTTVGNVSSSVKTVAFWTKVSTSTVSQSVMDLNGAGANVRIVNGVVTANGFTSPTIYVDGAVSSTLNNTNWHHVVITTGTNVNASAVNLGVASSTYFGGTLDDLRMYNRALSAAEAKRLYQLGN